MSTFQIKIEVDSQGNFTYSPSHLRVQREDTVNFVCPTGPFEVVFRDQSPGDKLFISSNDPNPSLEISEHAPYRIYHYAAAVYNPSASRVFIDAGCGDIGVDT
jgi:hypothetical protein